VEKKNHRGSRTLPALVLASVALLAFPQPPPDPPLPERLSAAALERTRHAVRYDGRYVRIPYPNGDVPADTGVCTDEIVRIYRAVGVDLQKEVHEDMAAHFALYPRRWGRRAPDSNIDHRRVPNLMTFFRRKGLALPVTSRAQDYHPGDIVTWDLGGGVDHIGMVTDRRGPSGRYLVVHNIGAGPQLEDVLFQWKITGHFVYPRPARAEARH